MTATLLNMQGVTLLRQNRLDDAEKLFDQAMAICNGALNGQYACVAKVGQNQADVADLRGDRAAARALLAHAAAVSLAARGPTNDLYGVVELKLGREYVDDQQWGEAEAPLKAGIAAFPQSATSGHFLYLGLYDLGRTYHGQNRLPEALALLDRAMTLCPAVGPDCEPSVRAERGKVFWDQGQYDQGEAELRKSADLYAAAGMALSEQGVLQHLARLFLQANQYDRAEAILAPQYAAMLARRDARAAVLATYEVDLAKIYIATGRLSLADPLIQSALARVNAGQMPPDEIGAVQKDIGELEIVLNRFTEAGDLLQRSLATPLNDAGSLPWWKIDAERLTGDLDERQLRFADAEVMYRKAIDGYLAQANAGRVSLTRYDLAANLIDQRRLDDAEQILRDLLQKAETRHPPDSMFAADIEAELALVMNKSERFKEAEGEASLSIAHFHALNSPAKALEGPLVALATAETGLGEYSQAETHLRASISLYESAQPVPMLYLSNARADLCDVITDQGRLAEAEDCARQALAALQAWPDAGTRRRMDATVDLGARLFDNGKYVEAKSQLLAALEIGAALPEDRDLATATMNLGEAYMVLGDLKNAAPALARGVSIYVKAGDANLDDGVEAGRRLGDVYTDLGRYNEAEPLLKASVDWFEGHMGPDHPRTALQLHSLGRFYLISGRFEEAEPVLKRALAIRQDAPSPNLVKLAQSQGDLGDVYRDEGRYEEARTLYREAETTEAQARGKTDWWVGSAIETEARLDDAQGRFADAEAGYERAAVLLQAGGAEAKRDALFNQVSLGELYIQEGRYAEAGKILQDALAAQQLAGADSPDLIGTLDAISDLDRQTGRFDGARAMLSRSLDVQRNAYGEQSPLLARPLASLAAMLADAGHPVEADQALDSALAIQRGGAGLADPSSIDFLLSAAAVEVGRDRPAEAQAYATQALAGARAGRGETSLSAIAATLRIADIQRRQGHYAEAIAAAKTGLAKQEAIFGEASPYVATTLNEVAGIDQDAGRYVDAEAAARRALAIIRATYGDKRLVTSQQYAWLARLLAQEGRPADAEQALQSALMIQRDGAGLADSSDLNLLLAAADVEFTRNNLGDAQAYAAQALAMARANQGEASAAAIWATLMSSGVERQQGRYADAAKTLNDNLASLETVFGADNPELVGTLDAISGLDGETGRLDDALGALRRSLKIVRATYGGQSPSVSLHLVDMAGLLVEQNRPAEAGQTLLSALSVQRDGAGLTDPSSLRLLIGAASIETALNKLDDAQAHAGQALVIAGASQGETSPSAIEAMVASGDVAWRRGRLADAEPLLTDALAKARALWGVDGVETLPALGAMAALRLAQHRAADAGVLLDQALVIADEHLAASDAERLDLMVDQANVDLAQDQAPKAETILLVAKAAFANPSGGPNRTGVYLELALSRAYLAEGRTGDARAAAQDAAVLMGGALIEPSRALWL
jgi:uncharacterized protein HemY